MIETISYKEDIKNISENWVGGNLAIVQKIQSPLFNDTYTNKDVFILKKMAFGPLKANEEILQCMIACQFNQVRIISSICEVVIKNHDNHVIFTTQNGKNRITYDIINLDKGGVIHD